MTARVRICMYIGKYVSVEPAVNQELFTKQRARGIV